MTATPVEPSAAVLVLVAVGGAVGAVMRHLVDVAVTRRTSGDYPWGILLVNVLGSWVLGLVTPSTSTVLVALVGVGWCGALTTYSTVAAQAVGFADAGRWRRALAVVVVTVSASVTAGALGYVLGSLWR